ncbi:MAG: NAD-dependent dehydratase [Gammaproteobacteria bacterium]|nr:NAD-dependent dehydratase [Gammaproteobacteria bacterium]
MNKIKNKNILVTGAEGFIGSHLIEKLVKGNCNVRAMVLYNSFNNWGWLDTLNDDITKNIEVLPGDIRDSKSTDKACENIDYVFHLASLIAIPYSYHSPFSYLDTNVKGTLNMLESSLKHNVSKFIHTSTSEVYGDVIKYPITELTKIISKSPYSATKIAADQLAYSYYSSFDLPVGIIRPFNTYGPRQSNRAIIPTIITQLLNNKDIKLGSLYPTRDFTFISDTIEGFLKFGNSKNSIGEIINIGTGFEISIKDLINMLFKITNKEIKIITDSKRIRPKKGEVDRLKASNKKAETLLNWKPKYSGKLGLEKGLIATVDWFENNLDKYKTNIYNL